MKTFGEIIKSCRIKLGLNLREFCEKSFHDPGNWSKMERGILPPPTGEESLSSLAKQLGIEKGSDEWHNFVDAAYVAKRRIPEKVLENKKAAEVLPIFFRTANGAKPRKEDARKLAEFLMSND